MKPKHLLFLAVLLCLGALVYLGTAASAQNPTTFRDASGRSLGTAVRNGDGTTTYRDAQGRHTGTATRNGDGTTTYRDGSNRLTGTSRK